MKRIRIMGLCLVAVFVMGAVYASAASAEAPEFGRCLKVAAGTGTYSSATCTALKAKGSYEWTAGPGAKNGFKGAGTTGTLETVSKVKITCKTEASTGEYTGPKTVGKVFVKFTGCEGLKKECGNVSSSSIETNELDGELVWEKKATKKVALILFPAATDEKEKEGNPVFTTFKCGENVTQVRAQKEPHGTETGTWREGILANVKAGKMETKTVQKYVGKSGEQTPSEFETAGGEKIHANLESEIVGVLTWEESGQTTTNTQTSEEAIEVNWFV